MDKNKPSKLKFGMFAGTLVVLAFLLIGTALYNTYTLTEQANINNQEMNKSFQQLSTTGDDSYKSQLQNILIGQATSQLSQYSKDITTTATANNNLLILWASGITLFTIGFVFMGFIEFKYRMQDANHLVGQMNNVKDNISTSLEVVNLYKNEFNEGLTKLDENKEMLSKTVVHVEDILSQVESIGARTHENSIISHFNLKIQGILNSQSSTKNKIGDLSLMLKEINSDKQLKNEQWQELSEKCNGYLGQLSESISDYKSAILFYDEVIRLSANPLPAYFWRANTYTQLGQHRNAIIDYSQILQTNSRNAKAYYLRGDAYIQINEREKATKDLNLAIDLDPSHAEAYCKRGLTFALEDYDKAIADFDKAIRLDPTLAEALVYKAELYHSLENQKEAIIYLTQALDVNPHDKSARNKRATCYAMNRDYEHALKDYSILISSGLINSDIYLQRAKAYDALSKNVEAISDYSESIRLNPNNKDAYIGRGMSHYIENQFDEALADIDKYLKLDPKSQEDADIMRVWTEINEEIDLSSEDY